MLQNIASLTDDIVIVDTGSNDKTPDIARRFGCKVHHFEWVDDFSKARNESLTHCIHPWVLILDADELVSDALKLWLAGFKTGTSMAEAYSIPTLNFFNDREAVPGLTEAVIDQEDFPSKYYVVTQKVRLFRRQDPIKFEGVIHETVEPCLLRAGIPVVYIQYSVFHLGYLERSEDINALKAQKYLSLTEQKFLSDTGNVKSRYDYAYQLYLLGRKKEAVCHFRIIQKAGIGYQPQMDYFIWESHFTRFRYSRYLNKILPIPANHPFWADIHMIKVKCLIRENDLVGAMKILRLIRRHKPDHLLLKKMMLYVSSKLENTYYLKNIIEPGSK